MASVDAIAAMTSFVFMVTLLLPRFTVGNAIEGGVSDNAAGLDLDGRKIDFGTCDVIGVVGQCVQGDCRHHF